MELEVQILSDTAIGRSDASALDADRATLHKGVVDVLHGSRFQNDLVILRPCEDGVRGRSGRRLNGYQVCLLIVTATTATTAIATTAAMI